MKVLDAEALKGFIKDVPDFPQKGIIFKDISPLLSDSKAFQATTDLLAEQFADCDITHVIGVESRGFIFAAALAYRLKAGFVLVRKKGKLPRKTESASYQLEYGESTLEIHQDAFDKEARVLIVDDVLATGGTAEATALLVERLGGALAGFGFIIELGFLKGREKIKGSRIQSLITY